MTSLRTWNFWAVNWVVWTLFGLTTVAGEYIFHSVGNESAFTFLAICLKVLPGWWMWALLTPLVFWLSRRFPLDLPVKWQHLAVQIGMLVAVSAAHTLLLYRIHQLLPPSPYPIRSDIKIFPLNCLTYAAVAATAFTVDYYSRCRQREMDSLRLQAQLTDARLAALRMQLHPHFLFNTLHAVSMLVRRKDNEQAVHMLAKLSELLRITLDQSEAQYVPLHQELDFIQRYLDIQQIRFGSRMRTSVDVSPDTLAAKVPSLVLLPLVENAIKHGISSNAGRGTVQIQAVRQGDTLVLYVRDDGPGWSGNGNTDSGIGLANTRARLAQMYNGAHDFRIAGVEGGGVEVTLRIPYEQLGDFEEVAYA